MFNVQKIPDNYNPVVGTVVRYTINVRNITNAPIQNVIIRDITDITGNFRQIPVGFMPIVNGFTGLIPVIAALELRTFQATFLINSIAPPGLHKNTVFVSANGQEMATELYLVVISSPQQANLQVTKIATPNIIPSNTVSRVNYLISVRNISNVTARNVRIFDTNQLPGRFGPLPVGFVNSVTSFTGTIGDIIPNGVYNLNVSYDTTNNIPPRGIYRNSALITLDNGTQPGYTANADVTIQIPNTVLSIIKNYRFSDTDPSIIMFTIIIKNTGTARAENVIFSDVINVGQVAPVPGTFLSIPIDSVATPRGFQGSVTLLTPNQEIPLRFDFKVNPGVTFFTNTASVVADNVTRAETNIRVVPRN